MANVTEQPTAETLDETLRLILLPFICHPCPPIVCQFCHQERPVAVAVQAGFPEVGWAVGAECAAKIYGSQHTSV